MSSKLPFIIVGGGIGGLACAHALALKGFSSIVLEQAPEFGEIGAGIQIGPNVFRMFEKLGVTDEINKWAVYPKGLMMRDVVTGEEVTMLPLNEAFLKRFKYPYAVIHRVDIHRVFLEACQRAADKVTLHNGCKIAELDDRGDKVVAKAEDGRIFEGCALIGADGLWSTVRQKIIGDGRPNVSGHVTYRAVLPTKDMPEHLRWQMMVIWAGEKTHMVQYPVRGGDMFNLVATFHSNKFSEGWDSFGDAAELHERFAGACTPVRELLNKIESWRMWVLCDRPPARDWSKGNLALLGDAAHPMLQYLAQGACMAIEDSVCLASNVAKRTADLPAALTAYWKERYLRTARVQLTAKLYGEAYHAAGATRDLRNAVLGLRTPEEAFQSMAWLYDPPPIGD